MNYFAPDSLQKFKPLQICKTEGFHITIIWTEKLPLLQANIQLFQ